MGYFIFLPIALAPGLLGTVAALRHRNLWSRSAPPPTPRDATLVIVAAIVGALSLGAVGHFVEFFGASLTYSDAQDGIPADVRREILIGAWVPALMVVLALVATRVWQQYRVTFLLALISPVLPISLWLMGVMLNAWVVSGSA